jgi:arsenate reductase
VKGVLFLCTRNACRSQMAEAFARTMVPPGVAVFSAGLAPTRLDDMAVRVMAEVGLDLTVHATRGLDQVPLAAVDVVITTSPEVRDVLPVFPRGVRVLHWRFDDPSHTEGKEAEVRAAYRNVREQIRFRLERFFANEWAER